jgi:hypothetical protein
MSTNGKILVRTIGEHNLGWPIFFRQHNNGHFGASSTSLGVLIRLVLEEPDRSSKAQCRERCIQSYTRLMAYASCKSCFYPLSPPCTLSAPFNRKTTQSRYMLCKQGCAALCRSLLRTAQKRTSLLLKKCITTPTQKTYRCYHRPYVHFTPPGALTSQDNVRSSFELAPTSQIHSTTPLPASPPLPSSFFLAHLTRTPLNPATATDSPVLVLAFFDTVPNVTSSRGSKTLTLNLASSDTGT